MAPFLGNSNKREVHDLSNQQTNCQIAEIKAEHRVPFASLAAAHAAGYGNCHWCLGGVPQ
jgi:hypothetical protein